MSCWGSWRRPRGRTADRRHRRYGWKRQDLAGRARGTPAGGEVPDAQLYIDLRGFTPNGRPMGAGAAAEALLRMLGVPADRIPEDAEGRIALWRRTMSTHRMILLLDNVMDDSQVRPLLTSPPRPWSSSRAVRFSWTWTLLIRCPLGSCRRATVSPSSRAYSAGRARRTEPEAVAQLTELCGHLPLALRIAAARLRKRPRWTVRYLVDRLRDDAHRLAELNSGERSVEVTLRLSCEGLAAETREAFRLLGPVPGGRDQHLRRRGPARDRSPRGGENRLSTSSTCTCSSSTRPVTTPSTISSAASHRTFLAAVPVGSRRPVGSSTPRPAETTRSCTPWAGCSTSRWPRPTRPVTCCFPDGPG